MSSATCLETFVLDLSTDATPGFYFLNTLGRRCYCFDSTGNDNFRTLRPGQPVKVLGGWSPLLKNVFEGRKLVLDEKQMP